jgi:hypothetical protein
MTSRRWTSGRVMIEFSERMPTLTPVDLDGSWSLQDRWTTTQMRRSVSSAVIGRASPAVARARWGFVSEEVRARSATKHWRLAP